jgi:glutamyl/glutaminyl-tRNA synthetase
MKAHGMAAPMRHTARASARTCTASMPNAWWRKDKAYYAFDTPEELEAMRERLKAAGVAAPAYNAVTREHMKNSLTLSTSEKERLARGDEHVVR